MNWAFPLKSIFPVCFGYVQEHPLGIPEEMLFALNLERWLRNISPLGAVDIMSSPDVPCFLPVFVFLL